MNLEIKLILAICLVTFYPALAQVDGELKFPLTSEILNQGSFSGCEGIAFNGEGRLFVTGARALWEIDTSGTAFKVTDLITNLGVAGIGEKDLLVADFGPTNAFKDDKNNDGIIFRITPEGEKTELVSGGIGDPNFILVMPDKSFLVSDDATNEIFRVNKSGEIKLFSTAVNHPNGLGFSPDYSTLYVAQIFKTIRPVIFDNKVWSIKIADGKPTSAAKIAITTGPMAANDGLVVDKLGRVYIAANKEGKIWRFDPATDELILITEDVYGVASIVFGEGDFDNKSIYFTTTYSNGKGGKVFKLNVGIEGMPLNR